MLQQAELVTIGKIERPFGVRGEARVRSLSDVPGRFERLSRVTLVAPSGKLLETTVIQVRSGGPTFIVAFEAFTAPEQIAEFRGGLVQIPRGDSPALPADQYYECDLVGLTVWDEGGILLGTLEDVWDLSGNQVFVVRRDGKELLIPAAKQVVAKVDIAGRTMTVRLPEGLSEFA